MSDFRSDFVPRESDLRCPEFSDPRHSAPSSEIDHSCELAPPKPCSCEDRRSPAQGRRVRRAGCGDAIQERVTEHRHSTGPMAPNTASSVIPGAPLEARLQRSSQGITLVELTLMTTPLEF